MILPPLVSVDSRRLPWGVWSARFLEGSEIVVARLGVTRKQALRRAALAWMRRCGVVAR